MGRSQNVEQSHNSHTGWSFHQARSSLGDGRVEVSYGELPQSRIPALPDNFMFSFRNTSLGQNTFCRAQNTQTTEDLTRKTIAEHTSSFRLPYRLALPLFDPCSFDREQRWVFKVTSPQSECTQTSHCSSAKATMGFA